MGIYEGAFHGIPEIRSLVIANGVKVIGRGAFSGCENLRSVSIPGTVESIDSYAFEGCGALNIITMDLNNHNGNRFIGDYAFYDCSFTAISTVNDTDINEIYDLINGGYWQFGSNPFPPDSEFGGI